MKDASTTDPATDGGDDQGNVAIPGSAKILPFEFKVLEVCLEHTSKCMETEVHCYNRQAVTHMICQKRVLPTYHVFSWCKLMVLDVDPRQRGVSGHGRADLQG